MLERRVPSQSLRPPLDPKGIIDSLGNKWTVIEVQKAAKVIASYLGLGDLVFVISIQTQRSSTAGRIHLDKNERDVFIELSPDVFKSKDQTLTVLSHEITHKFLERFGIRNGHTTLEDEYLTDTAAVYLGLGKLMLNGSIVDGSRVGYISSDCLGFLYLMTLAKSSLTPSAYRSSLCQEALATLKRVESAFGQLIDARTHDLSDFSAKLAELSNLIKAAREHAYHTERDLKQAMNRLSDANASFESAKLLIEKSEAEVSKIANNVQSDSERYLSFASVQIKASDALNRASSLLHKARLQIEVPGVLNNGPKRTFWRRLFEPRGVVVEPPADKPHA